ncbi:DddA-like double-stranded DNA deaminase toxin [Plantactinospora sp. WMMB334]|uniref:DddA-like double-stranded DNA deaminase toxin n=1 Tax=Plantactinospora sp. WMMB334 TaxID=3404119 RepID=UPI003B94D682
MTSVADVVAVLAAGLEQVRQCRAAVADAAPPLARAHTRLAETGVGSADARLDAAWNLLTQADDRLHDAATALATATAAVTDYVATIGAHLPHTGTAEPTAEQPWPRLATSATNQPVPAFVARAAAELRTLLPKGAKTVGLLTTPDGGTQGEPIWSGADGPAAEAARLRRDSPRRWHQNVAATQHVEGHAAAIMRRPDGPRHAVLVVSKRPCPGPLGCDRLLTGLLPAGATLTVYVTGKNSGPQLWKTYTGTGEGVTT